ncbi:MAG: nitroreductase family protein [Phycisphaerae bacterium]
MPYTLPRGSASRKTEHPIDPLFVDRWSPRAMSGEAISRAELLSLLEAARWAPSCFNEQPWRFMYALRDTPNWSRFFELMVEFNQSWTKHSGALLVIASRMRFTMNNEPNKHHAFDAGAAWAQFALEGWKRGLVVHGMAGIDFDRARKTLAVPEDYEVICMAAVGRPAGPDVLPPALRERELPTDRRPVAKFAVEGGFADAIR